MFGTFSNASAALNLTVASASVAIPGGAGPMLRIVLSAVVTATRIGFNLGASGVTAALPASGASSAGMVLPGLAGEYYVSAPGDVGFIAGITDAGTATIAVSRVNVVPL